jgi:hypothetical protein
MNQNVYIALIINSNNYPNFSQYDLVINLINTKFPNNLLIVDKYLIDGSIVEINKVLDKFIEKFPEGKRVVISITTTILTECSDYFVKKGLEILSISINATSNNISSLINAITYTPFNQYAIMSMFLTYFDYHMDHIHVLYGKSTNIGLIDLLNQTQKQADLLGIPLEISYLEKGKSDYNIKPKSMIIILALTNDLTNIYVTPEFLNAIPKKCYILLTTANTLIKDIFGRIPACVVIPTNLNYTKTTNEVYNVIKNNPFGYDYTSYAFYDVLFVLNGFTSNNLQITKQNYITYDPYNISPPAWIYNWTISPILNSAPYGKYQLTFTKDIIIGNDINLFLKYYNGGQENLPDSYSIFKIVGITPNNPSFIEYDEADYYKIYDNMNNLLAVKFNSDLINFPVGKNINIGKTNLTKFIYRFNKEGYFITLDILYNKCFTIPKVNKTMSKKTIKLKYVE